MLLFLAGTHFCAAGGFQINAMGIKAMSMGGSLSAWAHDASIVFYNPGGMGFLDDKNKFYFSAGGVFIMPKSSYLSPLTGKQTDMEAQNFIAPHFYGSYRISDFLSAGVSFNSPYGLGTKWNNDWEGKYISQEASLQSFYLQPAVSANISEKLGVGAGFIYAFGNAELKKAIPVETATSPYGTGILKGKGNGMGFNAGVYMKMDDKISFAVAYRSKIKIEVNSGDASFTGIPESLSETFPATTSFTTTVKLPAVISLATSYKFNDNIQGHFEINYTGWHVFDSLVFTFPYQYTELNTANHYGRKYQNVVAVRAGAAFRITRNFAVRAGAAYDQTPVKNGYVTPDAPDANKYAFTGGISVNFSKNLSVDISYGAESLKERQDENNETGFGGSFKSFVHAGGLGINYEF